MHITKVVIKNYRCLRGCTANLNDKLNVIVGNNECGKSTLLEAIHLTLCGQLNGRPLVTELHPCLFNQTAVRVYIEALQTGIVAPPPDILIELYFADIPKLAECKGTNNSLKENVPGVKLIIEFNEDYNAEYASYVADPKIIRTVPIEYYSIRLRTFADCDITPRAIPIKPTLIDASTIRKARAPGCDRKQTGASSADRSLRARSSDHGVVFFIGSPPPAGCMSASASGLCAYRKSGAAFNSARVTLRTALSG